MFAGMTNYHNGPKRWQRRRESWMDSEDERRRQRRRRMDGWRRWMLWRRVDLVYWLAVVVWLYNLDLCSFLPYHCHHHHCRLLVMMLMWRWF